ncbi:calcium-binding protein [Nocardioides piscis]|uniref:Calcium-binding protein n=1 Tax=Nocardioides piscis TaxID=2714938 RepID=A0A6G7YE12_9ACTN|nr:calcium-binding protein [Nocardioides piscis]QIK74847.1 calcium-binding protein [Nocardioides piscis]
MTLAAAALLTPALVAAPAAAADETCDGRAATIVVPSYGHLRTAPFTGTPGDDVIVGTPRNDMIDGAGGNDVICGLEGADVLAGGAGDDRLFGGLDGAYFPDDDYYADVVAPGPGDDHVDLGADPDAQDIYFADFGHLDRVSYEGATGPVLVDLNAGTATGEGSDTIVVGGPAGVVGSAFDDRITGSAYDDLVQSGAGDDVVDGLGGRDVIAVDTTSADERGLGIVGPEGDDVANGGSGRDTLVSHGGTDVLAGGADNDFLHASVASDGLLRGGTGDDRLEARAAPVVVSAGAGDDEIGYVVRPGVRNEIDGDGGRDSLSLHLAADFAKGTRVRVDRPRDRIRLTGSRTRIRYHQVEEFFGKGRRARWTFVGTRADERFATKQARWVRAFGRGGDDDLLGTTGRDLLDGGPGRDRAYGDKGRDTCVSIERAADCEVRR